MCNMSMLFKKCHSQSKRVINNQNVYIPIILQSIQQCNLSTLISSSSHNGLISLFSLYNILIIKPSSLFI